MSGISNQDSVVKDTIVATTRFVVPIGTNLLVVGTQSHIPQTGALAFDTTTGQLMYGNAASPPVWVPV
jgi:hypothetical protein